MEVPPQAVSISVAVDRVAVPMEEDAPPRSDRHAEFSPEEQARVDAVRSRAELDPRTKAALREMERACEEGPPPIVERNFRMAYCATVSLHNAKGEALHTIHYGRMPPVPDSIDAITHRDVHRLMERLRDDVRALRDKRPDLNVVLLAMARPSCGGSSSAS